LRFDEKWAHNTKIEGLHVWRPINASLPHPLGGIEDSEEDQSSREEEKSEGIKRRREEEEREGFMQDRAIAWCCTGLRNTMPLSRSEYSRAGMLPKWLDEIQSSIFLL
jgi:hypothetical protein